MSYNWPVIPLCAAQRKDIKEKDILNDGLYRKCNIADPCNFDSFTKAAVKFLHYVPNPTQFVVQLKGCPLQCPYCYVTRAGIDSTPVMVTTEKLLRAYRFTGLDVFHLMGGAPALYLEKWRELAGSVGLFHSDLLLVERYYDIDHLKGLPGIFAVSIKEPQLYDQHQMAAMFRNIKTVVQSGINFYITITGADSPLSTALLGEVPPVIARDVVRIKIRNYNAIQEQ